MFSFPITDNIAVANVLGVGLFILGVHALTRVLCAFHIPTLLAALGGGYLLSPVRIDYEFYLGSPIPVLSLDVLYWIGLGVLMFSAGKAIKFTLEDMSPTVLLLIFGSLLSLLPAYFTVEIAMRLAGGDNLADAKAMHVQHLVVVLCVVVTSVPFLSRIMSERNLLGTNFSRTVLMSACFVDLVLWLLLGLISTYHETDHVSHVSALRALWPDITVYLATFILIMMTRSIWWELFTQRFTVLLRIAIFPFLVVLVLLAVIVMRAELMIAALCAGLLYANCQPSAVTKVDMWSLGEKVFVPLYFAVVGASLSFEEAFSPWHALVFIAWSSLLKMGAIKVVLDLAGSKTKNSFIYATAMNTRGGPGIAMASFAFTAGMVDERTFLSVVMASLVTAYVTDRTLRRNVGEIQCMGLLSEMRLERRLRPRSSDRQL
ncbi:cation:proton antiporter [Pseudaestuariivita rosea]|uniref:cation:proton antiporter domain-containing protein n=1 Tax=Pseudaestuariivita rosea TaxID=2763263 RepID=UPI001ABAEDAE|nr:cation:proton antiporter [Pseudaestuariivita rosea]